MTTISIEQIETTEQIDAVRFLVREFVAFAQTQHPGAKSARAFEGLEEQLAALPGKFGPPGGAFLLATVDGAAAGCVAFFDHGGSICEVKRMYVRPEFRGLHLGEKLTGELIKRAGDQGFHKIVLDTFHTLKAAQHLYAKAGFTVTEPTFDLPVDIRDKVVFMELEL